ncbi:MAG TPA: LysM peptidoglycan-binding domain-containing protein, partial [Cyclobacteriaceae bacterium]
GSTYGRDRQTYKVRSGDVLGSIAIRHGVRVEDLRRWNNLRGNTIRVGQRLNIWSKSSGGSAIARASQTTTVPLTGSKFYTVQPGDTLWNISRRFEGLTIDKIKSLNNLADNKIQPGQRLVLGI